MTCIVGIIHKGNKCVYIGADSSASTTEYTQPRRDEKVFFVGDFLIGCTSSYRMIDILKHSFTPPKLKGDIDKYMRTKFISQVISVFEKHGFIQSYSDGNLKGGSFLVGYKDRLFTIDEDFQVGETVSGYDAIGSGYAYALGSLHFSHRNYGEEHRVEQSLLAAINFSPTCGGDIVIKSTKP